MRKGNPVSVTLWIIALLLALKPIGQPAFGEESGGEVQPPASPGTPPGAPSGLNSPVTFQAIQEYLRANPSVTTMEQFLAALPQEFKDNWILMDNSESAQPSPRFILQSRDARTVLSFSTQKQGGRYTSNSVEMIEWDDTTKKFVFREIRFGAGGATLDGNPRTCAGCHEGRPNWDPYDSWANMIPFNRDRLYEGSLEARRFTQFVEELAQDPRFGTLNLPAGVTVGEDGTVSIAFRNSEARSERTLTDGSRVTMGGNYLRFQHSDIPTSDEGRSVRLFDNLTELNAQRVAQELVTHSAFDKFKYALLYTLEGCGGGLPSRRPPSSNKPPKGSTTNDPSADLGPVPNGPVGPATPVGPVDLGAAVPPGDLQRLERYHSATLEELTQETERLRRSMAVEKARLQRAHFEALIRAEQPNLTEAQVRERAIQEMVLRPPENNGLTEDGIMVDREKYEDNSILAALRFLLEPEGVYMSNWSLSVMDRSSTYTFADLFDLYTEAIKEAVSTALRIEGEVNPTCERLAELSLAAYRSAAGPGTGEVPNESPGEPTGTPAENTDGQTH